MQAHRLRYPLSNFPGVWDFLDKLHSNNKLFSIDKVKDEIDDGDEKDELKKWANNPKLNKFFIISNIAKLQDNLITINEELLSQKYEESSVIEYLKSTDCYLIANSMTDSKYTVITEEASNNSLKDIKIPDVCELVDIECMNFLSLIRKEKAKFILN